MSAWMQAHWQVLALYAAAASLVAFVLMGVDKRRAKRKAWRISEKALFLSALAGGAPGAILGMWVFHHKTRHWYFKLGMPAILLAQVILLVWAYSR